MKILLYRLCPVGALVLLPLALTSTSFAARQRHSDLRMDQGSEKMANSPDVAFLISAVESGTGEVQLGTLASTKAVSPAVKALGRQLAEEHRRTNGQLIRFAAQSIMTLPSTMNVRDQALYFKLKNEPTASFDKSYLKAMVKDHKSDIKIFKKEAKKGRDEQIRQFASATVPMLHDHLTRIQRLRGGKSYEAR